MPDLAPDGAPRGPASVGFTLSQLGLATSQAFAGLVGTLDIEPRHFAVLRAVRQFAGESQQAIAERLAIPASTMVGLVDALEERGLVARGRSSADRRAHTLALTTEGTGLLERAMALGMRREQELCRGLTDAERATLLELLGRVAANLGIEPDALPDRGGGVPV